MVVVKKKLSCIIKNNKEMIKKTERGRYKLMTVEEGKTKIEKSFDRYYRLKSLV